MNPFRRMEESRYKRAYNLFEFLLSQKYFTSQELRSQTLPPAQAFNSKAPYLAKNIDEHLQV